MQKHLLYIIPLFGAPLIAITMLFLPPPGDLNPAAWHVAAIAVWMAIWWMTEVVPLPVTALMPMLLFPLLGVHTIKEAAAPYSNPIIYLFLGGFLVALAVEKWNLHKRIALFILMRSGRTGAGLVASFMGVAALLSMWVTNTATTLMLIPIALAVVKVVHDSLSDELGEQERKNFEVSLVISIAYAATMGGIATLVGTPPNAFLAGFMADNYGVQIGFAEWLLVGIPITITLLPLGWLILTRWVFPSHFIVSAQTRQMIVHMHDDLGAMTREEKYVLAIFVIMAVAWVFRPLIIKAPALTHISDTAIALVASISLFLIPASTGKLMTWDDARSLPWGILVLFGGGLSLASAISGTGLAEAIGNILAQLNVVHVAVLIIAIASLIIFLTELTSNLATTATFLPIVAAVATYIGADPLMLTVPVALAASCAFMLPVATPPNAIAYGSGVLTIGQMMKAGALLNLIGIGLISLVASILVPWVFVTP